MLRPSAGKRPVEATYRESRSIQLVNHNFVSLKSILLYLTILHFLNIVINIKTFINIMDYNSTHDKYQTKEIYIILEQNYS